MPINFHTVPTVSLKQACFSDNQYEQNALQKCLSNLLGVGFRRFTLDVYWDPLRTDWSLCPVEQPRLDTVNDNVVIVSKSTIVLSTATAAARIPEPTTIPLRESSGLGGRQDTSKTDVVPAEVFEPASSGSSSILPSSTSVPAKPTIITYPTTNGPPLVQIGSYNCTSLVTLTLLTGILESFLDRTATTFGAAITILNLNVHATSSVLDPDGPAPLLSSNQLPSTPLSDALRGNLSRVTYTPSHLRDERANLNRSWYNVDWSLRPMQGYYEVSKNSNGDLSTDDGWPTEAFMEFQELFRVVTGFGTIDPQMQNYNLTPDLDFIFPPGLLTSGVETSLGSSGQINSGCSFNASVNGVTSSTNTSWAIATPSSFNISANPDLLVPVPQVSNFTSCGLSAYLNETLASTTANKNALPYAAYVHSVIWSWAPGEPLNATSNDSASTGNRCVVMTISPYPGRWRVTDCAERHRVACHDPSQPYKWEVSPTDSDYNAASSVCRPPLQFSVPHTALENAHLLAVLQTHRQTVPTDDAIFVDLNTLSVPDCWVVGLNGTCPYLAPSDTNRPRIVIVPTVAAVIIFVLAVLTFFVKCAANRREDKRGRQRRMVGGWEYEGVPS